jgi:tetratricopeptide (TPR) repeat protein
VGFGRTQALAGDFSGATASLQEAIARAERNALARPGMASSARQLYWSRIALGDVFGNTGRLSLERPADAAAEYRKARVIAEGLVKADPQNEIAKLDLARTFSREAFAVAEAEPARALELLDRFDSIVTQSKSNGPSKSEARLTYLTHAIVPLVRTGDLERARANLAQARTLAAEMEKAGLKPHPTVVIRVEAILLYALGQKTEALMRAQEHLAMLPRNTNPVLSANYEKIKLLERMRTWAAGSDPEVCASAGEQLATIWADLQAAYPASSIVKEHAARARQARPCVMMPNS